jgi:hypothetical protein
MQTCRLLCTILVFFAFNETGRAATITAISSGNWVLPRTWNCNCVPAKGDNVAIPAGITVNVTRPVMLTPVLAAPTSANGVVISIAGELDLTNGALQLGPSDRVTIMPGGRVIANGLGGTIYIGITPYIFRSGVTVNGPFTIGDGEFPIALMFFEADARKDHVTLTWASAGEVNVDSYNILHSSDSVNFENVGAIKGLGYSLRRHDYSYRVDSQTKDVKYFRLEATGIDSNRMVLSTIRVNPER